MFIFLLFAFGFRIKIGIAVVLYWKEKNHFVVNIMESVFFLSKYKMKLKQKYVRYYFKNSNQIPSIEIDEILFLKNVTTKPVKMVDIRDNIQSLVWFASKA